MGQSDFGEVAERLRRSTVAVRTGGMTPGGGSGVLWSPDGLVITNAHVVQGGQAEIELWDRRRFCGEIAMRDNRRDLAALRIRGAELPSTRTADSDNLRPGEPVMAIGNPFGFTGALSTGVVHAVGPLRGLGTRTWVQAHVRLAPGNSGGPLADARGRVVGINTMIAGRLALAVPSNTVREFLRAGATPELGVVIQPSAIDLHGAEMLGLLVVRVVPDSPAENSSLLPGDVLLGANGKRFRSVEDLAAAIEQGASGVLTLDFLRGERTRERQVAVRFQPRRAMAA